MTTIEAKLAEIEERNKDSMLRFGQQDIPALVKALSILLPDLTETQRASVWEILK